MHRFIALLGLFWALPVFALAPPLSLEERVAAATTIIDAEVLNVECLSPPEREGEGILVSHYRAQLEVLEIHKNPGGLVVGETLELLFEKRDYGNLPQPGCGWLPSYREGQSGRWWLGEQGGDRLTMISWNSFEPNENNAPLDLPVCDENSGDRLPAPDGGPGEPDSGSGAVDGGGGVETPDAGGGEQVGDIGSPSGDAGRSPAVDGLCTQADGTRGQCLGLNPGGCGCVGVGAELGLLPLLLLVRRRRRVRWVS